MVQSNIIHRNSSAHKELTSQKNKARRFFAILLIFSLLLILFLYVLQVNSTATKGYKIRSLKKRIEVLENKNKILQVDISNLKSIGVLQSKIETFNMVKAQTIEYVTLPLTSIVAEK